VILNILC